MKNYFKNLFGSDVSTVYPMHKHDPHDDDVVAQIHREFSISGEKLLEEAKKIIAGIQPENEEKVKRLKSIGFFRTKEVVKTEAMIEQRKKQEQLAQAIEYFYVNYPNYKFITDEAVDRICKKYNLVMGAVAQFKGFVPEVNLKAIERFFAVENELNTNWYEDHYGRHSMIGYGSQGIVFGSGRSQITKEQYETETKNQEHRRKAIEYGKSNQQIIEQHLLGQREPVSYTKSKTELQICAPVKDMDTDNHTIKNFRLVQNYPDPVVLAPVSHGNLKLYCIVTAWGDEASDPEIVNDKLN